MKNYITLILIFFILTFYKSQVGINESNPRVSLQVSPSNADSPKPNEGVIVPRVTSLNITDPKSVGLFVFLDYEDNTTPQIERGFYWWDGSVWVPFFSMNKLGKDQTVTYVSCLNTFREGAITTNTATNVRTMQFNSSSLVANDTGNFEINTANELVIKKAGTYYIQSLISLKSTTDATGARDSYEGIILKNGVEPSPALRTAYGFPVAPATVTFDSNTTVSGFITVNENDRISIRINRYYRDVAAGQTIVTINPNGNLSNITLRYMGNL